MSDTQMSLIARQRALVKEGPAARNRERHKRLEDLAVQVLVALGQRRECERRAGEALSLMIEQEGLPMREALEWCGSTLDARTAARLRAVAAEADTTNGLNRAGGDAAQDSNDRGAGGAGHSKLAVEPAQSRQSSGASPGSSLGEHDASADTSVIGQPDEPTAGRGGAR